MNTAGYLKFDTKLDTQGFQSGINKMTSATQKGGGTIKNIVAGLGITKIIGMGMSAIKNSLDGAISRFDTLRNYPKVMESLGYSTDDAKKSIDKLSDGIEGLPTSLDEIVASAQSYTATLDDMEKGTQTAIAVNDMLLASGKGVADVSRANEAYNKILSKGKVEMENWQTMVEVAPAQMRQLSEELLGAGHNQRDLYDALKNGTISMDEFNDAVIKLDTEGGKSFSSFHDQAMKGTEGIATSIANVKTAIVKNVEKIIGAINDKLEEMGLGTISENINKVKDVINDLGKKAIEVVPKIIETVYKLRYAILGVAGALATIKTAKIGVTAGKSILGMIQGFQNARVQASLYRMEVGKVSTMQTLFNKDLTGTEKAFAILQNSKIGQKFSDIGSKASSGASGVLNFLKAHKGLSIGLGVAGLAIGGMIALYKKSGGDANKMADMINNTVNRIVTIVTNIATKLPDIINQVLPKLIDTVSTVLPKIIETMTTAIPQLIPVVVNGLVTLITALVGAIPILVPPLINGIVQIFLALVEAIPLLIPPLINGAIQLVMALVEALPTIIIALVNAIPTIITSLIEALLNCIPQLIAGAIQLVFGLVKAIPRIIKSLIQQAPRIIAQLVVALLSAYGKIYKAGWEFIKKLWNGIKEKIPEIKEKVKNFAKSLPDKIKAGFSKIKETGKNLVKGLWEGIKNAKDWVLSRIKEFGSDILNGLKKILKIKSPSRATMEMGINLDKGIILGIDKSKKSVMKTISDFGDEILSKMQDAVAIETGNMNASTMLKANANYNNAIVLNASFDGTVDIDGKKAGRIIAPSVVKTIKTAGGN